MAVIKCKYCSKIYDTICGIIKHLSTYKMRQEMAYHIVSYNTLHKRNNFLKVKAKAILFLTKPINGKKVYIQILLTGKI